MSKYYFHGMTRAELIEQIKKKQSYLCVGLDVDYEKMPAHLQDKSHSLSTFVREIVEATRDYAVGYKFNLAFYEGMGVDYFEEFEELLYEMPSDCLIIGDAKRGDIGNTSKMYASALFNLYDFDAATVAPYMGKDSVTPFLEFKERWTILLALTSNSGADDFQKLEVTNAKGEKKMLFEEVLSVSKEWSTPENMMYVVGATQADMLKRVRAIVPEHFLLVPGVGAQGGSLEEVSKYGMNKDCGLLVNSSRQIIYASSGEDFAEKAGEEAKKLQQEMKQCLETYMR
jgi:orotidine-5'-phosphate decarboxylase